MLSGCHVLCVVCLVVDQQKRKTESVSSLTSQPSPATPASTESPQPYTPARETFTPKSNNREEHEPLTTVQSYPFSHFSFFLDHCYMSGVLQFQMDLAVFVLKQFLEYSIYMCGGPFCYQNIGYGHIRNE